MVHLVTVATILLAVGNAAAQSTRTYSYLVPVSDDSDVPTDTLHGTIISSNPTKTTFIVVCPTDTCGPTDFGTDTIIFGPSSVDIAATNTGPAATEGPEILSLHCDFTGTTRALCTESISGIYGPQSTTATYSSAAYQTILATAASSGQLSSSTSGKTTAGGTLSATTAAAGSTSTTGIGGANPSKGAGAHMCPSNGGILAAFMLWGLFS